MAGGLGGQPHWASVQGPSTPTGSPGNDLPGQGQASNRNEVRRLLYTFGTIFCDSFHICIHATSFHILAHSIKKCYMDYFLCRPIYAYPYTINLTYYVTIVLIMKNYFSHQIILAGVFFYMLYMKLMWCSGFPEVYAQLEEAVGSVCHGYMCILLYVKLIWCSGVA